MGAEGRVCEVAFRRWCGAWRGDRYRTGDRWRICPNPEARFRRKRCAEREKTRERGREAERRAEREREKRETAREREREREREGGAPW